MARVESAIAPFGAANSTTGPSEEELFRLHQYDKIVQLRDAILSGSHPRIKLPPGAAASTHSSIPANNAAQPDVRAALSTNLQSFSSNAQKPATRPEINPIFLEKSDDLIRAELQLQRQRLERALKEEVEQRRVAKHTQAETIADLDLNDVLLKALTLVQAPAPSPAAIENLTANNEAASDSFDDNTFYSSRHDTPESHLTSRIRNESEEAQAPLATGPAQPTTQNGSAGQANTAHFVTDDRSQPYQSSYNPYANGPAALAPSSLVPGLNNYADAIVSSTGPSQNTSGEQSQSEDSGIAEFGQQRGSAVQAARPRLNEDFADAHPPSPLVRTHDMMPVAPQPSHMSSLAVAGRLAHAAGPGMAATIPTTGTPAQVAALRGEPGAVTSPESSPQGGRRADKRKAKKKKRNADRQAPEAEATPYIKPEPRSPSPVGSMSHIRPNKRAKHTQPQADEHSYDAPRYEPAPSAQEHYGTRQYRDERIPIGYQGAHAYPQRAASTALLADPRYGREYIDDRRISGEAFVRRHPSPGLPAYPYPPSGSHLERPVSEVVLSGPYAPPPRSYRDPYESSRMTARPESEFYTGIPRPQPTRIVVDASGREYMEPPRPSVRQSVAPSARPNEPEVLYERAPTRAVSRHPGAGPYEEGNVVYAGQSSPYGTMPRRVVTQPEYVSQEYRDTRQREYSTRPMAPYGEHVQVMAPPDRRQAEERSREYIGRAPSVRPAGYGVPHEYARTQSVRPEAAPAREYAASVHPEGRREMAQPHVRGYGGAPVEQPVVRREYSVRPVERYYEPQGRPGEEIAFIERPRGATQEVVYADDARREVYR